MIDQQKSRIAKMESYLDESSAAIKSLMEALRGYEAIQQKYFELVNYYSSSGWIDDFEADEAGLIPAELKRGVLSEDAVYDLIAEHHELIAGMQKAVEQSTEGDKGRFSVSKSATEKKG